MGSMFAYFVKSEWKYRWWKEPFVKSTVESRFNEPLVNEVLDMTFVELFAHTFMGSLRIQPNCQFTYKSYNFISGVFSFQRTSALVVWKYLVVYYCVMFNSCVAHTPWKDICLNLEYFFIYKLVSPLHIQSGQVWGGRYFFRRLFLAYLSLTQAKTHFKTYQG